MQYIGAQIKRKSLVTIQPQLPKLKTQQRSSGKRTIHKDLVSPSEQLKDFKRRLIFTQTTDKSLSRLASEQRLSTLQNSRTKNLEDFSSSIYTTKRLTFDQSTLLKNYQSEKSKVNGEQEKNMEDVKIQMDKEQGQQKNNQNQNQNQNFEGYEQGSKYDGQQKVDDQKFSILDRKLKSYSHKNILNKTQPKYQPVNFPEKRMQAKYWDTYRKNLRFNLQNAQILRAADKYKIHKQHMIDKANKKMEVRQMIAKMKTGSSIPRAISLPRLSRTIQPRNSITIPSYQQLTNPDQQRTAKYLSQKRLQGSLSAARILIQNKRKMIEKQKQKDDEFQGQMDDIYNLQDILRQKGVQVGSDTLRKGLLNVRQIPTYGQQSLPQKKLLSNPLYKITPLQKI